MSIAYTLSGTEPNFVAVPDSPRLGPLYSHWGKWGIN